MVACPVVPLSPAEARCAVLSGRRVRMVCGAGIEDPTLIVWLDDGLVLSAGIAGWSAGVVEPVCDAGSAFLLEFLDGRVSLSLELSS